MYDFLPLTSSQLFPFKELIPKNVEEKILALTPNLKLIAYGVLKKNQPIGIGLASLDTDLHLLEIWHISLNAEIETQLLATIQKNADNEGAKIFSFIYPLNTPETPIIEKMIAANHWKGNRPFLIRATFTPETFNAPMVHLNSHYPPGYKEFLWKNLKTKQRNDLLYREKQGHFSRVFSPFRDENIVEPLNSLGLEFQGRVVGWIITHRTDPNTVRYSTLYIEPSLKFKGLAMKLLADSMHLHMKTPTPWAFIEIPYLQVHPSWIHFIEKRILPSAVQVTRFRQAWHTLA